MFSLREFIKKGLLLAIGQKPEYEIRLAAAGWLEKGVLSESDLAEIEAEMDKQNTPENGGETDVH